MSTFPLRTAVLGVLCAATFSLTAPAQAARFHGHAGLHIRHVGASFHNRAGDVTHIRATRLSGNKGVVGHRSKTTHGADGSIRHRGGTNATGANGGTFTGRNRYTRSADGSVQAAYHRSGTGKSGGSYDSSGSYTRDGRAYTADRQTSITRAGGGSYQGSTSRSNGRATHDTTLVNTSGDTYTGQTSYTRGQGVTHSGTCTAASGNVIPCRQ